jgi:hypothetical protein
LLAFLRRVSQPFFAASLRLLWLSELLLLWPELDRFEDLPSGMLSLLGSPHGGVRLFHVF